AGAEAACAATRFARGPACLRGVIRRDCCGYIGKVISRRRDSTSGDTSSSGIGFLPPSGKCTPVPWQTNREGAKPHCARLLTVFGIWMSEGNQLPPARETARPTYFDNRLIHQGG